MNLETKENKRKIKLIDVGQFRKHVLNTLICIVIILLKCTT